MALRCDRNEKQGKLTQTDGIGYHTTSTQQNQSEKQRQPHYSENIFIMVTKSNIKEKLNKQLVKYVKAFGLPVTMRDLMQSSKVTTKQLNIYTTTELNSKKNTEMNQKYSNNSKKP